MLFKIFFHYLYLELMLCEFALLVSITRTIGRKGSLWGPNALEKLFYTKQEQQHKNNHTTQEQPHNTRITTQHKNNYTTQEQLHNTRTTTQYKKKYTRTILLMEVEN